MIALFVHPKNSNHLRSHLRAIMALDHSRLGLENKSGRIFCVRQVFFTKSCEQIWGRENQPFILFIHLRWNSTIRRFFYHTNLGRNAVFHNFEIQTALIQYLGQSRHAWAFSETAKKFQNNLYGQPVASCWVFEWTLIELRFNIVKNLSCFFFI